MNVKTIETKTKNKLNSWLSTIEDKSLADDIRESLIVSGGSIASMLLNEQVNDYDIYLNDINIVRRVALYYTAKFPEIEVFDGRLKQTYVDELEARYHEKINKINNQYAVALRNLKEDQIKLRIKEGGFAPTYEEKVKENEYRPVYFSANAISLSNDLQIVLRFHGAPEKIHETFDFIHATNYFTFRDGLVTNTKALESLLTKQLIYQGSKYPLTSIIRSKKFIKRGFNISAGEYLKIMFQISELDLTNIDVLEEQLIGVDVAYFSLLIDILRKKYETDINFRLTSEYINALIDKVFKETE